MSVMKLQARPSPNFDARGGAGVIDMLILHYTGMKTAQEALDRLCDPAAKVSAHYLIDEDGTVWQLVDELKRAWHAGVSSWRGRGDINSASIGIELVNPGHEFGYRPFPETQMVALEELAREILPRHKIPARHVLGHSDIAPQRKQDPGELFDWVRMGRAGIGLWPEFGARARALRTTAELQAALAMIGYACPISGELDAETHLVVAAFQRHFRPKLCDGAPDAETRHRIASLASVAHDAV
jgi:N-acetylmuramoyl-L-alanine amidase